MSTAAEKLADFASTDVADALAKLNIMPAFLPDVLLWSPEFVNGPTKIVGPAHTVRVVRCKCILI